MGRAESTRRQFLTVVAGGGMAFAACTVSSAAAPGERKRADGRAELKVAPAEDLMREHGVLRRVLLIYDESTRRLGTDEDPKPQVLAAGTEIIRRVIQDYHEKLEEEFLFPRFKQARKELGLVKILDEQHRAGRRVIDEIRGFVKRPLAESAERQQLAQALRRFTRMYRPHAAREDTVLFPAFHKLIGQQAYTELGETFEARERKVLGEGGFGRAVAEVATLEQVLGTYDLAQFTPR